LESEALISAMSMLENEPPETDAPSDGDRGGVSLPELSEVQVLERDRDTGLGRENTGAWTMQRKTIRSNPKE
jgi:hypothetical protein